MISALPLMLAELLLPGWREDKCGSNDILVMMKVVVGAGGGYVRKSKAMPTRYPGAMRQDWEPVVLHRSKPMARDLRNPKAVNQALRSGAEVKTIKKFDAGSNKKAPARAVNARKLEEETEPAALERVSVEVRQAIQRARIEKKMSQAEQAKLINERPQVVQEYENGKAVPSQAVLAKMEKVLGIKLRGKFGK
ncbi:Multiprotein-bridging factor 1c [Ancistrocladus abbreviatus]